MNIYRKRKNENYTKWAYHIWNDPEMGKYLPDEAKEDIDEEYLKELEVLDDSDECCYLIPALKDSMQRVGTYSFMMNLARNRCDYERL